MKLHNTMSRTKEELKPIKPGCVSFYSCGPTVYDYPHVGNWTGYIYWDILVRTLVKSGFSVNWYMNLTDVGHLVSDDDTGEDKLETGAKREGKSAWDVAKFYTEDFKAGLKDLSISIPLDHLVAATDHIPEQIELIKKLEGSGFTYKIDDGIYFDSTKVKDYGKLARLDIAGLEAGKRVAVADKKSITDFALWKFSPEGTKRDMEWDSPWGVGFPGWHIECSAMAMEFLGETIDIHAGGIDHIPVHHTNEIAQSEAATGKTFVNYWLHNNHMMVSDQKISKSLQNGITLQDVKAKGYSPDAFKLLVLQSHYRTQSNFSWDNLHASSQRLKRWKAIADLRWQENGEVDSDSLHDALQSSSLIIAALQDDLDTPKALVAIEATMESLSNNLSARTFDTAKPFFKDISELFGFDLTDTPDITPEQKLLINERHIARDTKDWKRADEIRDELLKQHVELKDVPHGQIWSRTN